ncbi:MAG: type II toxin-antitoxin system HicB family antitoxin [Spirochaetaceae bacterium]|jgi:predicted RNase H-like HicB family nuclease|nr:type II toxin-antitoxin system HicB family antitoxin [Spirochaetaceae bacterium]
MVYFCEINKNDDGLYIVNFPDKPNVKTCGTSEEEAVLMAEDALNAIIETEVSHGIPFVAPKYKKGRPVSVNYGNSIAATTAQAAAGQAVPATAARGTEEAMPAVPAWSS